MFLIKILIFLLFYSGFISAVMAQEKAERTIHLSLRDALQTVDTINFQVMMANARLEQAIARIAQAQSALMPNLEGDISGNRQSADLRYDDFKFPGIAAHIGPYNNFDARIRVSIALFDPAAFERFQAVKKGALLSAAELEKTREDIMALVAELFVDAERKQQTFNLMKTLLERDQMAFQLSQDGYIQGTGTLLDSNKFKSNLDQTKYLYSQARLQAHDAALDLSAALQLPLDVPLEFIDEKEFMAVLERDGDVDFNHTPNADIALASSQLEARKADEKSAYADFLPKVSGAADYGRMGESPDHGSNTFDVGVQVSVPIWEGGSQQANLKEVKGEIKEAQENLQDASQQEQVGIAKARVAIAEGEDLLKSKTQERQTDQRALRIAFHAQQIGSGSVLDVMKAKADLAVAEDEYNEAKATWVMAHIDLLHAEGRLRDLVKKGES